MLVGPKTDEFWGVAGCGAERPFVPQGMWVYWGLGGPFVPQGTIHTKKKIGPRFSSSPPTAPIPIPVPIHVL